MTREEYEKMGAEVTRMLESLTNGAERELKDVAESMTMMHHALRQYFTSSFVLRFVGLMAKNYREGRYDKRDEWSATICNAMWEMCKERFYCSEDAAGRPVV